MYIFVDKFLYLFLIIFHQNFWKSNFWIKGNIQKFKTFSDSLWQIYVYSHLHYMRVTMPKKQKHTHMYIFTSTGLNHLKNSLNIFPFWMSSYSKFFPVEPTPVGEIGPISSL